MTTPIKNVTFLKNDHPVRQTNDITQPYILADIVPRDGGNYRCLITVLLHNVQPYNITPTSTAYLHGEREYTCNQISLQFPTVSLYILSELRHK